MKPTFIPSHSRISSEPPSLRPRLIKFLDPCAVDPDAPPLGHRLATAHPGFPSDVTQRSSTACVAGAPQPTGTFGVEERPRLRRAVPSAQFEMVTPPRSPIDTSFARGSRLPARVTPTSDVKRRSTIARVACRAVTDTHASGAALTVPSPRRSPSARSSMIPIRKDLSILGWNESRASFAALNAISSSRVPGRRALPSAWTEIPSRKPNRYRPTSLPVASADPMAKVEPRRARSDPEVTSGGQAYPQLTTKERNVLVRKLKVLLKYIGIESQGLLDGGQNLAGFQKGGTGRSGRVFGTSVITSSSYASCQVVLGEHSHTLPTCVFACIEDICRRGITMPALFRVASPPNKRTLEELAQSFDRGPSYGANASLASEDIFNICALLKLYLRGLPEAALSCSLWPILRQLTSELGPARIAAFQAILHLQHPVHFSLLVYVLAFLHQLVRHGSQNGLDVPTLAAIFGPALFSPRKDGGRGCPASPTLDGPGPVFVEATLSPRDVDEGTRIMSWVLEHWDEIATGLLSLDVVHGSEMDIQAWEASFAPTAESGSICGRLFRTPDGGSEYSEGPSIDGLVDSALERLSAFPFPENVTFDHVLVHEVRDSIVDMSELPPRSTHTSSPATLWSQETGKHTSPPQAIASRTPSLEPVVAKLDLEPKYVQDLRLRIDAQEAELASLRQELSVIRSRFVFPLPPRDTPGLNPSPNSGTNEPGFNMDELDVQLDTQDWLDEDTMPTPRPPSGSQFATMRALVDSLRSQPVTPLYPRVIGADFLSGAEVGDANSGDKHSTSRDSGYSTPSCRLPEEEIPRPSMPSDPESSMSLPSHEGSCRANSDVEGEGTDKDTPNDRKHAVSVKETGKFEELLTARDALRSALAAMDPVKAQLQAVEKELKLRDANSA